MTYNQLLPFAVYAVLKRRRIEKLKKIAAQERLLKLNLEIDNKNSALKNQKLSEKQQIEYRKFVNVIHLIPNDIYFIQDNVSTVTDDQLALISELDYSDVAKRIELFFDEKIAGYALGNNLYEFTNIKTSKYVNDAKRGLVTINLNDLVEEINMMESLREPKDFKLFSKLYSNSSIGMPEFVRSIKSYLMSNSITSQVPMLIGFSGLAKSAIVKDLVSELDSYYQSSDFINSTVSDNKEYSSLEGTVSLVLLDKDKAGYLGFSENNQARLDKFNKFSIEVINNLIAQYNSTLSSSTSKLDELHNRNFRIISDEKRVFIDSAGTSFFKENVFVDCRDKIIDDAVKFVLIKNFVEPDEIVNKSREFDNLVNAGKISKVDRDSYAFDKFKDLRQYGMRLIDVRCAFLSPFDLEGLNIIKDSDIGNPVGMSAPFDKFMLCTDEFIYFARSMIEKIKNILKDGFVNNHVLSTDEVYQLKKALDYCKYYAKIPVLFFDEITRSDRGIQGALTTIINQRRFLSRYNFKLARIISATNAPVGRGYEDNEDLSNFFVKTRMGDKAMLDRFIRYKVSPDDIYLYWLKWAEGKGNLHPLVLKYIKENGQAEIAYDVEPAIRKITDSNSLDDMIPPYPTYRAWEMVSDYLKSYEARKNSNGNISFNLDVIKGLLGFNVDSKGNSYGTAINFYEWLLRIGFVSIKPIIASFSTNQSESPYIADEGDIMAQVLEDALEANLPVMLMGVSGLGKTQRVIDYKDRHGYNLFEVNLASKERFDILGASASVGILNYITKEFSGIFVKLGIDVELVEKLDELGISRFLTVRAPKAELRDELHKAIQQGRKLIIYFDEFNRALDQKCQSAIFEVISDSRLLGVTFPRDLVKIVLTGNIGNQYEDTRKIDPALPARCVQVFIKSYTDVEAKNTIKRWYRDNYNSYLLRFIESFDDKERLEVVKKLLSAVDSAELLNNVSSSRLMKEFSDKLNEGLNLGTGILTGSVLVPDDNDRSDFWLASDDDIYLTTLMTAVTMSKHFYNWGARLAGFLIDTDDPSFTLDEAIDEFVNDILPLLKSENVRKSVENVDVSSLSNDELHYYREFFAFARSVVEKFMSLDEDLMHCRRLAVEPYLGSELTEKFVDWLNFNSGRASSIVTFDDLTDITRVSDYVTMCLNKGNSSWSRYFKDVYLYWKTDIKLEVYMKLLSEFIRFDVNSNNSINALNELIEITDDVNLNKILLALETFPYKQLYIESVLNPLGFSKEDFDYFESNFNIDNVITGFYDRYKT